MKISIYCNLKDYFKLCLGVLTPVTKLTKTEAEVAATIMYLHHINKGQIAENEIFKRIMSPVGRKIMADTLKISQYSMNMHVVRLKKKGILTKTLELSSAILKTYPENNKFELTYAFNIAANDSSKVQG